MSTATESPLVAVCGATGAQGSSVAKYLLDDGGYRVRALTRNPECERAQALKKRGAEVVKCDLGDKAQVTAALSGSYAVFGVTNFWEHGEEREINQGKNLADAAKSCGVKHFLWSSVPRVVDGEPPRHWESKAIVDDYLHEIGVPTTTLYTAFYYENLWMFFLPKQLSNGTLLLDWFFPNDVRIPSFAAEDLGAWFMIALKNPSAWIGKRLQICSELLTPREYAEKLSIGLGTKVLLKKMTYADFERAKPNVPTDVWLNIKAFWDQPYLLGKGIDESQRLYPELQNLEKFVERHKGMILDAATPA